MSVPAFSSHASTLPVAGASGPVAFVALGAVAALVVQSLQSQSRQTKVVVR